MNNNYKLFIIIFLFIKTICDDESNTKCLGSSDSPSECQELLSINEKANNQSCCFFTAEKDGLDISQCILLDEDDYNNLDLLKKYYYNEGYSNVDIICGAFYFKLNIILFYLISLFFLFIKFIIID